MMLKKNAVFQTEGDYNDTLVAIFLCDLDAKTFVARNDSERLYVKEVQVEHDEWLNVSNQEGKDDEEDVGCS